MSKLAIVKFCKELWADEEVKEMLKSYGVYTMIILLNLLLYSKHVDSLCKIGELKQRIEELENSH